MLKFTSQEHPESCVPACVRMVLDHSGIHLTESEIYQGCETDIDGTLPSKAASYVTSLGLNASSSRLDSIAALESQINSGYSYPIVFVNLSVLLGINVIHAVLVESLNLDDKQLAVIDPAFPPLGYRQWSLNLFDIGWQMARRQAVLIESIP